MSARPQFIEAGKSILINSLKESTDSLLNSSLLGKIKASGNRVSTVKSPSRFDPFDTFQLEYSSFSEFCYSVAEPLCVLRSADPAMPVENAPSSFKCSFLPNPSSTADSNMNSLIHTIKPLYNSVLDEENNRIIKLFTLNSIWSPTTKNGYPLSMPEIPIETNIDNLPRLLSSMAEILEHRGYSFTDVLCPRHLASHMLRITENGVNGKIKGYKPLVTAFDNFKPGQRNSLHSLVQSIKGTIKLGSFAPSKVDTQIYCIDRHSSNYTAYLFNSREIITSSNGYGYLEFEVNNNYNIACSNMNSTVMAIIRL